MNDRYNFYNLEASFKNFLTAGNKKMSPVSVKNYLSDLRHFLGWLILKLKTSGVSMDLGESFHPSELATFLTESNLTHYRAYLTENNIPLATINRRLSTLRKFCSFFISQRWLNENPAKRINNIGSKKKVDAGDFGSNFLNSFDEALEKDGVAKLEKKAHVDNVKEFLTITSS